MTTTSLSSVLERHPDYEATIGVEVHVQLLTQSKIFCSCSIAFGAQPNTHICVVCTGQPGALPVLNKKALEYAIMMGIATESRINTISEFARKHYFYPDLPKKYQVTQGDRPICENGKYVIIRADGSEKVIRINRIHMEEDAGKNIHGAAGESFVDCNRAGTPLIEIVSEPDLQDSHDVREYLTGLHSIVRYLGICDGNMEEGSFRADVNVSVKKKGASKLGTRVELKNINSFRYIVQAVDYEIDRQISLIQEGGAVKQETRLWDSHDQKTVFMRSKESSYDYRYFSDPDLPLVVVDDEWVKRVKTQVPELAKQKIVRFGNQYGLSVYEATILTGEKQQADFYEAVVQRCRQPKMACNWVLRDLLGYLKESKQDLTSCLIEPEMLGELIQELVQGVINAPTAQEVFAEMAATGKYPSIIIQEKGLQQIGDESEILAIIEEVLAKEPDVVASYRGGNQKLFGYFVGQVMKKTSGRASPQVVQPLLKKALETV
ncbi:Asp-tRNA(Asn)/Glu-tRNA(Gln) amidotransferase subunit GatB [Candidatus Dependentiae bacterium]|nr:Asp-tRNA(Asn)/Glu-tRNA(Gln) amidotransferase subunit GatB [Candidatus Dependentiae bacterium]